MKPLTIIDSVQMLNYISKILLTLRHAKKVNFICIVMGLMKIICFYLNGLCRRNIFANKGVCILDLGLFHDTISEFALSFFAPSFVFK